MHECPAPKAKSRSQTIISASPSLKSVSLGSNRQSHPTADCHQIALLHAVRDHTSTSNPTRMDRRFRVPVNFALVHLLFAVETSARWMRYRVSGMPIFGDGSQRRSRQVFLLSFL